MNENTPITYDTLEGLYSQFRDNLAAGQRKGQAFMNALAVKTGDMWDKVMNAGLDCFYDDDLYPKTLEYVVLNWKESGKDLRS